MRGYLLLTSILMLLGCRSGGKSQLKVINVDNFRFNIPVNAVVTDVSQDRTARLVEGQQGNKSYKFVIVIINRGGSNDEEKQTSWKMLFEEIKIGKPREEIMDSASFEIVENELIGKYRKRSTKSPVFLNGLVSIGNKTIILEYFDNYNSFVSDVPTSVWESRTEL